MKVISNRHNTQIKISDAYGSKKLLTGAVSNLGIGDERKDRIDSGFILIYHHDLVI